MSGLLALHGESVRIFDRTIHLGGIVGLGMQNGLTSVLNYWGAAVVLWSTFFISFVWLTEKSLIEALSLRFVSRFLLRGFRLLRNFRPDFTVFAGAATGSLRNEEQALKQRTLGQKILAPQSPVIPDMEEDEDPEETPMKSLMRKLEIKSPTRKSAEPRRQITIENWELPKLNLLE
jgi:hypothetical protein